jgi:hypothetical protein
MIDRLRTAFSRSVRDEAGQALILVLILLVIGSLTIAPVLSLVSTAIKNSDVYEDKTDRLYAADAGVEDAIWQIKYDGLEALFGTPDYAYDFTTNGTYQLDEEINGFPTTVTIENIWIPLATPPNNPTEARTIMESNKLMVSGTAGADPADHTYKIILTFYPDEGEFDDLMIDSIGVWLPYGFSYVPESSSLEELDPWDPAYSVPNTCEHAGGQAIVWDLPFSANLTLFPGVNAESNPLYTEISFEYSANVSADKPSGVAWIETSGMVSDVLPVTWDIDTRVFKITSAAGDTEIEAYSSRNQLRDMYSSISGDYKAFGNSLMEDQNGDHIRDHWQENSDATVNDLPDDGSVLRSYLYWSGWRDDGAKIALFQDNCSDLDDWTYGSPTSWSVDSNSFQGDYTGGGDAARLLTLSSTEDLSSYVPGSAIVVWDQRVDADPIFSDSCSDIDEYWDDGSAWSEGSNYYNDWYRARSSAGDSDPGRLLTLTDGMDLTGGGAFTISWDQCVSYYYGIESTDGLDYAFSSDNGSNWSEYYEAFRGNIGTSFQEFSTNIPAGYLTTGFKIKFKVVGFTGSRYVYIDDIRISPGVTSADGLDFSFSSNGGTSWSGDIEAFRGDIGSSNEQFVYTVPDDYLSGNFKMRFKVVGMTGTGQAVYVDNIKILVLPPDTSAYIRINDTQVYLDGDGNPQIGFDELTADESWVLLNTTGYSYSCKVDITELVQEYSADNTGKAKYTVGNIAGDVGNHIAYAGWSIIIVYYSPETAGRQLYLYDTFAYNDGDDNLDFDFDGEPGGDIVDFLIPEPPEDLETYPNAAKITAFVGEGDEVWHDDYIALNGTKLWDGITCNYNSSGSPENVWNCLSVGLGEETVDGVDIDTFEISWTSGLLEAGDTSAHLDIVSDPNSTGDNWNLVYVILSVRSETHTGGTAHYLIHTE